VDFPYIVIIFKLRLDLKSYPVADLLLTTQQ